MSLNIQKLDFSGGFNRSQTPFKSDLSSCYELLNLACSEDQQGYLKQTPYFNSSSYAVGTYYDSGSLTEPAGAQIYGGWRNLRSSTDVVFSSYTARVSGTQAKIFYQTTCPTGSTLTKGCYVVINNVASLGITLGQTLDIVIDAATTFKWRKNGGAYTTGVAITTTGVSIDGGNATVYFLTSSGFTVADTWSWTRNDAVCSPSGFIGTLGTVLSTLQYLEYAGNLIWISTDSRVMFYNVSGGYMISLGYQPTYGFSLKIFNDHLFIGNGVVNGTAPSLSASKQVINSDLNDIHNFISTDVNEVDSKTFSEIDQGNSFHVDSVFNFATIRDSLFCFTGKRIFSTSYLGLPNVFSWDEVLTFSLGNSGSVAGRVLQTNNGVYILRQDGVWFFDGANVSFIGNVMGGDVAQTALYYGAIDYTKNKVYFLEVTNKLLWVHSEITRKWHRRSVSFTNAPKCIFFTSSSGKITVGGANLTYYSEDSLFTGTPVKDSSSGASFTLPSVTSNLVSHGEISQVKEMEAAQLMAQALAVSGMSASYLATTNVTIKLYWGVSTDGTVLATTSSSSALWTSATPEAIISFPRVSFRAIALKLEVSTNDTTKPPCGVGIFQLEPRITPPAQTPTR